MVIFQKKVPEEFVPLSFQKLCAHNSVCCLEGKSREKAVVQVCLAF